MAGHLHQQPGTITAGATAEGQGFFAGLYARFQAHDIINVAFEALIQRDQKVIGRHGFARYLGHPGTQSRPVVADDTVRCQVARNIGRVVEWVFGGVIFEKEVEGIDGHHIGNHFDLDSQPSRRVGKDHPCEVITVGILLPINEMPSGRNVQGIGLNARARVGRGFQAQNVRSKRDRPIELVVGEMTNGNPNGHAVSSLVCGWRCRWW